MALLPQLHLQVLRARRYALPRVTEEASPILACLPPLPHSNPVLDAAGWPARLGAILGFVLSAILRAKLIICVLLKQWVPITANLIVHVFMYLYYGLVASGHTPWWKQMITVLQIAQFVVDVIVCWWGIFMNYFSAAGCTGDVKTSWFGALLLSSYLGLFIDFYQKTYKSNPKAPSRPALQSGTLAREKAA